MSTSYEHQLNTLLKRFNFHFIKGQLQEITDSTARSKNDLKDNVLSVIDRNSELQNKIRELGVLALQLDTRQVEIFRISNEEVKSKLGLLFGNIQLTDNASIKDAFPFPIEDSYLLQALDNRKVYPVLVDTSTLNGDVYNRLVLSVVVDKEIEEPVPPSHLSQTGLGLQIGDTIFTMKRKVRTQLFHVIYWCSDSCRLILSADRGVLSLTASQDQLFHLRRFLSENMIDCGNAIDVFGAIEPLYNAIDGYITKLGHVTTDGNPVRIPLAGRKKCLKKDNYHQAGEGNGHVHAKFSVSKKWEFKIEGKSRNLDIEVALAGQPRMLDTAQPLTDFSVNKPKRLEDFGFAINKVLSHVPSLQSNLV